MYTQDVKRMVEVSVQKVAYLERSPFGYGGRESNVPKPAGVPDNEKATREHSRMAFRMNCAHWIVKRHPELPPLRHEELPPPSGS